MFPEFLKMSTIKIVGSPPSTMLGLAPTMTRQAVLSGTHGFHHTHRPQTTGSRPYGSGNLFGTPSNSNVSGVIPPQAGGFFVAGRKLPFSY